MSPKRNPTTGKFESAQTTTEVIEKPTRQDLRAAMAWTAMYTNQVPTFWGPSEQGKTHTIRIWAQEMGYKCYTILASADNADEILGLHTFNQQGQLVRQYPEWLADTLAYLAEDPKHKVVWFFDEIGKARKDVHAALLTLFRDRTFHWKDLPGTELGVERRLFIVGGTNPASFEYEMLTRMALIYFPEDFEETLSIVKEHAIARLAIESAGPYRGEITGMSALDPIPPPAVVTPGKARAVALRAINAAFYSMSAESQQAVLLAFLPEHAALKVWKHLQNERDVDPILILRDVNLYKHLLANLDTPLSIELALGVWSNLSVLATPEEQAEIIQATFDVFLHDPDKVAAWYDAPTPEALIKACEAIPPEVLEKAMRAEERNGELVGAWADLVRELGTEEK